MEMDEDQIIKAGLKENTKQDIMCYIGMGILFLMIFVPPIFRIVFFDPNSIVKEVEVVYLDLNCRKTIGRQGYLLHTLVNNNYKDSIVQKSVIKYTYELDASANPATISIPEIENLLAVEETGFIKKELTGEETGYEFTLDFANNKNLINNEVLKEFGYAAPTQTSKFRSEQLICETKSETVIEERRGDEINQ